MGLKLQSSGGGSVELNAPVTASSYAVSVPGVTGTLLVSSQFNSYFGKGVTSAVAFSKTGTGTAVTATALSVQIGTSIYSFAASTTIVMPTLTAGTDYAIYACSDGTLRADSNFSAPTGYTTSNSTKIGGFHYAPGGNATAQAGGNTTPQINEYSFWDLLFKPSCPDPRGMALVGNVWVDIYLTNTNYIVNGTSKYNVTMADGASPPLISPLCGGTGSNSYSSFNWYEANEVVRYVGKRLPTLTECHIFAYGTTEASSIGSDQVSTILNAAYTSKYGIIQSTGVLWQWTQDTALRADIGGGWNWYSTTGGRGSNYEYGSGSATRVLFGGNWLDSSTSGSRCSLWNNSPTISASSIGVRAVCDHLILA